MYLSNNPKPRISYYLNLQKNCDTIPAGVLLTDVIKSEFIDENGEFTPRRMHAPQAKIILRHLLDNSERAVSSEEMSDTLWILDKMPYAYKDIVRLHMCQIKKFLTDEYHIASLGTVSSYRIFYVPNIMPKYKYDTRPKISEMKGEVKRKKPKLRSPAAASLKQKQFQPKIVPSKKKYNRNRQKLFDWHKNFLEIETDTA